MFNLAVPLSLHQEESHPAIEQHIGAHWPAKNRGVEGEVTSRALVEGRLDRVKCGKTYTVLVLTNFLERSPARHECGVMLTGLRAKGCGSVRWRAALRNMRRTCVAEGMFVVFGRCDGEVDLVGVVMSV